MAADATMTTAPRGTGTEVGWLTAGGGGTRPAGARLLDVDPDLGRRLDPVCFERLAPVLRVRIERADPGPWEPDTLRRAADGFGLLLVDGLLLRDMTLEGRCCAELLGPGDLLRPWAAPDDLSAPGAVTLEWSVVRGPARFAVLDRRTSALVGRFPAVVTELLDRTVLRAQGVHFQLALTQVHGIARRLELLLWRLADRWGRVTPDGVVLPVDLTHEMLGRLIGARRPSVSTALGHLDAEGTVVRLRGGWLLRRDATAA